MNNISCLFQGGNVTLGKIGLVLHDGLHILHLKNFQYILTAIYTIFKLTIIRKYISKNV